MGSVCWEYCVGLVLTYVVVVYPYEQLILQKDHRSEEVCYLESFLAECAPGKVVLMTRAMYGQMAPTRCYEDTGDYSCTSDVLAQADTMCSGRTQCEIKIPNGPMENSKSCIRSVKGYFEAEYDCVEVSNLPGICQPNSHLNMPLERITLSRSQFSGCGIQDMIVQAKPGQQVNITLIDFNPTQNHGHCVSYGEIRDEKTEKTVTLCGGQNRKVNVMTSLSYTVTLNLNPVTSDIGYLLMLEVVGCEDPVMPDVRGAWMNRSQDVVTMGCKAGGQVWYLHCEEKQWKGTMPQCQQASQHEEDSEKALETNHLPSDILITSIVCTAVLVVVVILTTGYICYRRSERLGVLRTQQQKYILHTLQIGSRDYIPDQSDYLSPSYTHERPPTSYRASEAAYNTIHVLHPTEADTASTSNAASTGYNTLCVAVPDSMPAEHEHSRSSHSPDTSSYQHQLKYFVLDKNLVTRSE